MPRSRRRKGVPNSKGEAQRRKAAQRKLQKERAQRQALVRQAALLEASTRELEHNERLYALKEQKRLEQRKDNESS